MIVNVPSPPVLLPGLTGRPVPEVEALRTAALTAIRQLLQGNPAEIVVVGAAGPVWDGGQPLAALIGSTLLAEADYAGVIRQISIDTEATSAQWVELGRSLPGAELLVVADGSARRGVKAPGYLDDRAGPFDDEILAALQSGDPAQLAALDPTLAAKLMVAGYEAWQVMAAAAAGRTWRTETFYADDPFGVFYPVVAWR